MEREEILRRLEEVNARIAEIKAKIASRKAGESDTDDDAEYRTARHDYIVNGDRSGLDAYWRGKEAEKQRRAQEEANRLAKEANDRAAKAELDKANQAAIQEAKDYFERKMVKLDNAREALAQAAKTGSDPTGPQGEYNDALVAYNQSLRKLRELDPGFTVPEEPALEGNPGENTGLDRNGLNSLQAKINDSRKKGMSDDEYKKIESLLKEYRKDNVFAKDAQALLDELSKISTPSKRSAAAKAMDDKVNEYNSKGWVWRKTNTVPGAEKYGYKLVNYKYVKGEK